MKKDIITEELDKLQEALKTGEELKPFHVCSELADHTTKLLKSKKISSAATGLNSLEKIYCDTANIKLKTAIENVFLYRIGNFIFLSGERLKYMKLLPRTFRDVLMRQMVPFGI